MSPTDRVDRKLKIWLAGSNTLPAPRLRSFGAGLRVSAGILVATAGAWVMSGDKWWDNSAAAAESAPQEYAQGLPRVVAARRLTEAQYRNTIADIFGPDVAVSGRFEPLVRAPHQLLAASASSTSVSPTGMEQFDAVGRGIAAQVFDEEHRATFVSCAPASGTAPDPACAREVLSELGRLLFRRPLSAADRKLYVEIAGAAAARTGSFYTGLEMALAAMLVSPEFLYVMERTEADPAVPGARRLDAHSVASRLSYFLWNTTPSAALLGAADQGLLDDRRNLQAIASKMVASPRFEHGVRAFFSDMLMFEMFDELNKDPLIYRRFNADVAKALPEQLLLTVIDELVARKGDYRQLFTTRRTFMNRTLGPLYGVPVAEPKAWVPYEFSEAEGRAGLTSLAGFLSIYAHSGRSSPTLRGRAIRELLLCQPVPNPPGNVDFKAVQETQSTAMPTARIRLSSHNDNPVCAGCHKITDPIGLTLEKFDGIGAFRSHENGSVIDVAGALGDATFTGPSGLGAALSRDPAATQCLATRALEYATGRPIDEHAASAIAPVIHKGFGDAGYRITDLFLKIATGHEFYRVGSPANSQTAIALR